jgi:hypothetical protein
MKVKPSTAPFSELPAPAITVLHHRPPLIPRLLLQLQDPVVALPGQWNSLAGVEAPLRRTVSPLHPRRPSPVRTAPPHLVWCHPGDTMVFAGKTLSPAGHHRAASQNATTSALHEVTARPRRAGRARR